ncbi:hypothetical protein HS088_TW15G00565 [Tripterygium wilfordii]|uniref:BZIP domain-containing protein n=1 Tax=Tripterygium wilfordii TaxID=458696 RepID=A0A7J7CMA1_TRIWF|nr:uncharacterized protein LOC120017288 [Tripterygium wilfordii]XP_038726393.1 uncharacterized protein LOC120017288 [Tripterygium wilfordii]XP_038726394.1 uncharacterized protein LOC120017288 [Tripterygium wilfordii]XP_038726395.1 uncharacterized protein LOC120017288 [Tripterygium wilfordii]KAF5735066.1 hypothetical protein HS088_TW15G00565 [Tripterygium wilfordii]
MEPLNQSYETESQNDVMNRRLKNRERQRRYRARKRLEADLKKSHMINKSTTLEVGLQPNENLNNCRTRVHCLRNWKKDARMAHACKNNGDTPNASVTPALTSTINGYTLSLPSDTKEVVPPENNSTSANLLSLSSGEAHKPMLVRRDWKSEARKKKH